MSNPRRRSGHASDKPLALKTATLMKAATFHCPPSKPINFDGEYLPPRLLRSQYQLDDVANAHGRRMALTLSTLDDIDEALFKTSLSESKPDRPTRRETTMHLPRGPFDLPVVDPVMAKANEERQILRPHSVRRNRHHASDSGLGSSIASTNDKSSTVHSNSKKNTKPQAATRTSLQSNSNFVPSLGPRAVNCIHEYIIRPLLDKPSLKPFESIILDVPRRIRFKEIICLRDVEKALIFMAPEKTNSAALYMDFCLTSIRCASATVEHLGDYEQIRPGDRPYTSGYFIDLKEQIYEYGRQLANTEKCSYSSGIDIDKHDEVRLFGGIAENGRPAELIRIKKDGTAISMATGKLVDLNEPHTNFKRSLDQQLEDDEEMMRSMARRKKNATAEEVIPKECGEPGCGRVFIRSCDLTKHQKTHSRPWKCPIANCKYHNDGWPTEKERDRHVNDKHSDAPAMHECLFKPCMYKSKRESNCKQHMEKKHGWTYIRTKASGKKKPTKPMTQDTPSVVNLSPPSTTPSLGLVTPPQDVMANDTAAPFPMYPDESNWLASVSISPETIDTMDLDLGLEKPSPSSPASSYEQLSPYQNGSTFIINDEDLYAARMLLPTPMPMAEASYKVMQQPMSDRQTEQLSATPQVDPRTYFSPVGQSNAMLFTPPCLRDTDEGFDDSMADKDVDFQLFDASACKMEDMKPLFDDLPSAGTIGFSQNTQPDFFRQIDLSSMNTMDYASFQE